MQLRFSKLVAAGNRYAAFDGRGASRDWSRIARSISRPVEGADTDGIVVVEDSPVASFGFRVFNSDGSEAEISGNGLRLAVKFALDRGLVPLESNPILVETRAGVREVWPTIENRRMTGGRIRMGPPRFASEDFPGVDPGEPFHLDGVLRDLPIVCVSLGNPHAVAVLDEPVDRFPLHEIGALIQTHVAFPNRINFEVVNVVDPTTIRARFFERGEGETPSSGTGSTAAAVVCRHRSLVTDEISVLCTGGTLGVTWRGRGDAFLEGPTDAVASGRWHPRTQRIEWDGDD